MKNQPDHLEVLRKIHNKPEYTQRKLAKNLGFSLGKLNYFLKALHQKVLIKIEKFTKHKNKITYVKRCLLTNRSIKHRINHTIIFMKKKMKEYDQFKSEIKKGKKEKLIYERINY